MLIQRKFKPLYNPSNAALISSLTNPTQQITLDMLHILLGLHFFDVPSLRFKSTYQVHTVKLAVESQERFVAVFQQVEARG